MAFDDEPKRDQQDWQATIEQCVAGATIDGRRTLGTALWELVGPDAGAVAAVLSRAMGQVYTLGDLHPPLKPFLRSFLAMAASHPRLVDE